MYRKYNIVNTIFKVMTCHVLQIAYLIAHRLVSSGSGGEIWNLDWFLNYLDNIFVGKVSETENITIWSLIPFIKANLAFV